MSNLGHDELFRRYGYHRQGPGTAPIFELNRALIMIVAEVWDQVLPPSRETSLAFTELEAALQRANQSVACNLDPNLAALPRVDVSTQLDDLLDRLEGPELTRSGVASPLVAPDRPVDVEGIARVCHEANRAWQRVTGDPVPSPSWAAAPEWQRASAVEGVQAAIAGATPRGLHESWMRAKLADGWTFGAIKDAEVRTHPCLVPYDELPPEQRRKDDLFGAIVAALTR